jgi:hypothetical protein
LSPFGVPAHRSAREQFDQLVLNAVEVIERRWHRELGLVEFAVEEIPILPADWSAPSVPLATLVPATSGQPTRLVLFRRPIELRCDGQDELAALVHAVLVEQVAELLGRSPEEIDPRGD